MKTRAAVSILILGISVMISGCATILNTKLNWAAKSGDYVEVSRLIDEGEDISARDLEGYTALMWASKEGYADIVKLLIEEGADVNAMTKIKVRSTSFETFSGGRIDKDYEPTGGYTALMAASEYGHTVIVKLLLDAGADVNARHWDDATALDFAMSDGHKEAAMLLMEAGADMEGTLGGALMSASLRGDAEFVKWLIDIGADVNARSYDGFTALMEASYGGCTEIFKLLIDAGADVNAQTSHGWTALMYASYRGHPEGAQLLIEAGADVNARNNRGRTALKFASRGRHTEIVKLLKEAGAVE